MVEIEFNLNQVPTVIQTKLDDLFKVAINKFTQKNIDRIKSNTNKIHFFSSEKLIKSEENIENQMKMKIKIARKQLLNQKILFVLIVMNPVE